MSNIGSDPRAAGMPGTAPTSGPVPPQQKRPGAFGYWLGGGLLLVGTILAVVMVIVSAQRLGQVLAFPSAVDAADSITLTGSGDYVVYVIEDASYGSDSTISAMNNYPEVAIRDPEGSAVATSDFDGFSGTSVRNNLQAWPVVNFHAERPGDYQIVGAGLEPGQRLGVARQAEVNPGQLVLGFLCAGILFIAGIILLIVTAVRRRPPPRTGPPAMAPYPYTGMGYPPYPGGPPPGPWGQPPTSPHPGGLPPGPWGQPSATPGWPPPPGPGNQPPPQPPSPSP